EIVNWFGSKPLRCSAGFWMKNQFQQDFLFTAGHCPYPYNDTSRLFYRNDRNSPVLIGPMENFTLTPNDIGFIRKSNPDIKEVKK
ncbi:3196_t:CDS:2, partial [Racocetra persica]